MPFVAIWMDLEIIILSEVRKVFTLWALGRARQSTRCPQEGWVQRGGAAASVLLPGVSAGGARGCGALEPQSRGPARHLPARVHTGVLGSPESAEPAWSLGQERNAGQREKAGLGCPQLIWVFPGLESVCGRKRHSPSRHSWSPVPLCLPDTFSCMGISI